MRLDVVGVPTVTGPQGTLTGARLGGRRAQVLLVALALDGGAVPGVRLADLVWEGAPPTTWSAALRGVVRGVRTATAAIGFGDQDLVATVPGGYRLAAGVEVDLIRAEHELAAVREEVAAGRDRGVTRRLEALVALRGADLLAGSDAGWLAVHRARVDELSIDAQLLGLEALGHLHDYSAAASAARRLVGRAPYDERAHRALIVALDAAGDRSGVVRAFETCRSTLAEELGVDPSPETVTLYLKALGESTPGRPARVPVAESTFWARASELRALVAALDEPGLVTVTGPGGVGKSRIAAEAARSVSGLPGGTWWIPLEAVGPDALVLPTIALTMGLVPGEDPGEAIGEALSPRGRALLVLDGGEAALDGTAAAAEELAGRCPALTVLTTSRAALGLGGERLVRLDPWRLPDEGETRADHPLVGLLVDRVAERGGELSAEQATGPVVRGLLKHCAGLPLAVELVAAQLAVTAPGDLVDQLDDLLTTADDPVRAVAQGSYALLSADEARVFRRFAVLDGAVPLTLARDVLAGPSERPRVLRILGQLAALGLLRTELVGPRWRWFQDDELHRYARQLLSESGDERAAFQQLGAAIRALLPDDPRQPPAGYAPAVTDVLASLRSLLSAALDGRADAESCLELTFRLHRYWAATNVGEGRFWLARLLEVVPEPTSVGAAYATYALGYLDYWSGDSDEAIPRLREAADLLRGIDDQYVARALIFLAGLLDDTDEGPVAVETIREAVTIADRFGPDLQMPAVMGIGSVLSERGDPEAAEHAARGVELARAGSDPAQQLTVALPTAAMICWQVGAVERAAAYVAEALPLHQSGPRISRVVLYAVAAGLALADDDAEHARALAEGADRDGTELGVDRELPLVRAILARARLRLDDTPGARDAAVAALEGGLALAYDAGLAIGLETAAAVLQSSEGGLTEELADLLAAAATVRARGHRPAPSSLRVRLPAAPTEPVDVRAAARLAIKLLAAV